MKGDSRRLFAKGIPAVTLLVLFTFVFYLTQAHPTGINLVSQPQRRLLQAGGGPDCSIEDIDVQQGPSGSLPSGIPTYTVSVLNLCSVYGGCPLDNVHLSCGEFSSVLPIDPIVFRRLSINDCLLNDGRALDPGAVVSFEYANSFPYPLAISNATC